MILENTYWHDSSTNTTGERGEAKPLGGWDASIKDSMF